MSPVLFVSLLACLLSGCVKSSEHIAPTGTLRHSNFVYNATLWAASPGGDRDEMGNASFGIQLHDEPVMLAFVERADESPNMSSSALVDQFVEAQRARFHRLDQAGNDSVINSVATPSGWACKHHIAAKRSDTINVFYSVCMRAGTGYWSSMVVVAPIDVTDAEIVSINDVLRTIRDAG